jgi:hypothetical protein
VQPKINLLSPHLEGKKLSDFDDFSYFLFCFTPDLSLDLSALAYHFVSEWRRGHQLEAELLDLVSV